MDLGPDAGAEPGAGEPDPGNPDPALERCQAALEALAFTWDQDDEGWVHDRLPEVANISPSVWPFDHWERGAATSGPNACRSGEGCWATNLDDNYVTCQRAFLQSPVMDLAECADHDIELVFHQFYDFLTLTTESGEWTDGGLVEISGDGGATWSALGAESYNGVIRINPDLGPQFRCLAADEFHVHERPGYVLQSNGWQETRLAIPRELRTETVQVRLVYSSGVAFRTILPDIAMQHTAPGWYLDDLSVEVSP